MTQAEYDQIRQIGLDVYNFDVGETLASAPEEDEKILAKLDWNINEYHRATLAYQRTEGNELTVNTTNNNAGTNRLGAPSNWYDRAILMETASLQLFSDWNEFFSTEVKFARKEVDTAQVSLFGTDFGEMIVSTPSGGRMFIGSDEFRHANELTNDIDSIKLKGSFFLGDHTIMVGYEREMLDIFNIFVPRSQGQWNFASIDDFEAQAASSLSYSNAFTNDAADGAATFGYDVDSFYVRTSGRRRPTSRSRLACAWTCSRAMTCRFSTRTSPGATASTTRRLSTGATWSCRASASTGSGRRRRRSTAAGACSAAARRTSGSRTASRTTA